ncbi:MAG: 2-amino-4-hydroxy-6-hydroxymethyldihydropteridine diphosphokinase [Candidatus Cloacimonetes bacterium]|nr:2-amino-4-hydroxy-6-hydroxymethyldihydropteridine diphosphokinase [Candidatus Cloacimonadota bacterium]
MICYFSLGSNLGDRLAYINKAIDRLAEEPGITILRRSAVLDSKAYGRTDQPDFLNCIIEVDNNYDAETTLEICLKLEKELGRSNRRERWSSREIDIDILFYGNRIVTLPHLKIPHPGIIHRKYLLEIMRDFCPDLLHPLTQKTMKELFGELS